jgi:hypothetical protein
MPIKKHTITCNQIKQLIDLNGDMTNFELNFKAMSEGNEPFDVLVVDQDTLDSNPDLPYKRADTGSISGSITADKNEYQNYFLILKSEKPCNVTCEININEVQPNLQPRKSTPFSSYPPEYGADHPGNMTMPPQSNFPPTSGTDSVGKLSHPGQNAVESDNLILGMKPWVIALIVIGCIAVACLLLQKPSRKTAVVLSSPAAVAPPRLSNPHTSLLARLNSLS